MRRRYLVAYDIANDRRLRRVHKIMKGYGDGVQYSVFLCDLAASEVVEMKWDLSEVMNEVEDQVLIVDLGRTEGAGADRFQFLGRPPNLPAGGAVIV